MVGAGNSEPATPEHAGDCKTGGAESDNYGVVHADKPGTACGSEGIAVHW